MFYRSPGAELARRLAPGRGQVNPPGLGVLTQPGPSPRMRLAIIMFLPIGAAIILFWWFLGAPRATDAVASGKLYCVSYSPFRDNQTPLDLSTRIDPAEIEGDLVRLSRITDCVRIYSVDFGLDRVAEIAARHNMKVILGAWIGSDAVRNHREITTVTALAKQFPDVIRAVVVGNECLLRGEISPSDLADVIRNVKKQVSVPVTYADVWEFWLRYREVYDAVDFVTIHVLPYWEDFPVAAGKAAAHLDEIQRKVATAFPAKEILVGEVGWPSAGRMREGALPSPANQARVIQDVLAWAEHEHFRVNLIEAFDQSWKRELEGTAGGHWGLFDGASREPKFILGSPISNHPFWRVQAAGGVLLAALVLGAAAAARRRTSRINEPLFVRWGGVAVTALIPGALVGWAIENVPLESLGAGGWARSIVTAALAILAPLGAAVALMRRLQVPSFAQILGGPAEWPRDRLAGALGVGFAVLCVIALESALGLVFDPRYRDFPFAPLTAAALPFLVLSTAGRTPEGERGLAETVMAAALTGSAVYIAINEGFANWQSLWLCAVFLAIVLTLFRARDAQSSR
jgi:exo-beta-1,3-glucanase (GH17 family)